MRGECCVCSVVFVVLCVCESETWESFRCVCVCVFKQTERRVELKVTRSRGLKSSWGSPPPVPPSLFSCRRCADPVWGCCFPLLAAQLTSSHDSQLRLQPAENTAAAEAPLFHFVVLSLPSSRLEDFPRSFFVFNWSGLRLTRVQWEAAATVCTSSSSQRTHRNNLY